MRRRSPAGRRATPWADTLDGSGTKAGTGERVLPSARAIAPAISDGCRASRRGPTRRAQICPTRLLRAASHAAGSSPGAARGGASRTILRAVAGQRTQGRWRTSIRADLPHEGRRMVLLPERSESIQRNRCDAARESSLPRRREPRTSAEGTWVRSSRLATSRRETGVGPDCRAIAPWRRPLGPRAAALSRERRLAKGGLVEQPMGQQGGGRCWRNGNGPAGRDAMLAQRQWGQQGGGRCWRNGNGASRAGAMLRRRNKKVPRWIRELV